MICPFSPFPWSTIPLLPHQITRECLIYPNSPNPFSRHKNRENMLRRRTGKNFYLSIGSAMRTRAVLQTMEPKNKGRSLLTPPAVGLARANAKRPYLAWDLWPTRDLGHWFALLENNLVNHLAMAPAIALCSFTAESNNEGLWSSWDSQWIQLAGKFVTEFILRIVIQSNKEEKCHIRIKCVWTFIFSWIFDKIFEKIEWWRCDSKMIDGFSGINWCFWCCTDDTSIGIW